MKKYTQEGYGVGDERAIHGSSGRPEILRVDQNSTSTVNIERATGNGTTVSGTMPLVNADNNQTQTMKP